MAGNDIWTIRRILDWTRGYLERKGDEHPRLSAEWLLSNATGLSRVELYMNFDKPLQAAELDLMRDGVRRRGAGEPLQYVTGEMPFRHIVLRCEKGVLIPRPETEILVDAALEGVDAATARGDVYDDAERRAAAREEAEESTEETKRSSEVSEARERDDERFADDIRREQALVRGETIADDEGLAQTGGLEGESADEPEPRKPYPSGPRVLEVGTGTGCIALSIAGERLGTSVWATDLSAQAVKLARRNRDALDLGDFVRIREGDLVSGVPDELMGTFSVFVSNPPYIPSAVVPTLPMEVQGFEPGLALDGGPDGLDVFRRLLAVAPQVLAPEGMLCVELFEDNVHAAAQLVREQPGWAQVEVREDLTHRPRVLVAIREA
ncbi:MAG: HemK/PrmC family methyltransferase [Atopobiaceae bacterium]|nr:HemK/PrmC family methyltransferase [Atopobiaceae bacterium]